VDNSSLLLKLGQVVFRQSGYYFYFVLSVAQILNYKLSGIKIITNYTGDVLHCVAGPHTPSPAPASADDKTASAFKVPVSRLILDTLCCSVRVQRHNFMIY
jgi:hypothetical protein